MELHITYVKGRALFFQCAQCNVQVLRLRRL